MYDFTETRERRGPQQFLKSFRGFLQADAYGGYDGIYVGAGGAIVEVACWTHCRRYWWKAREHDPQRAYYVLAIIGKLYEIKRAVKGSPSSDVKRCAANTPWRYWMTCNSGSTNRSSCQRV